METEKKLVAKAAKKKLIPVFDLFENSWKMYWSNFKNLVTISLYGLLAILAIFAGVALIAGLATLFLMKGQDSMVLSVVIKVLIVIIALATLALAIWYSTRAKAATYLLIKNGFSSVKSSWEESKGLFTPFFLLSLLVLVLVLLWSILLIIPGIIFAVFYSFAVIIFIFEGKKGMSAIKASKELVKGYWWATFGRLVFLGFALYLFSLIVGLPGAAFQGNSVFVTSWNIIDSIIMFIVSPFLYVFTVLLYKNLKEVKK
ncbi:MAG: hypothetical protein NT165_02955 [Candidatus Falkowbacteria bacterium]|nr:hypothetical protein [Candidatus Falkowbacteria bacterium]